MTEATFDTTCSAQFEEPLAGTAKAAGLFLALEHSLGWSHDILDGGVWGADISAQVKKWLKERGAALQLIRKPGRLGQIKCAGVSLYIAHAQPTEPNGVFMEHLTVASVEEMLSLDIQLGQTTPGARRVDHPLYLVCTHGKRDRCCAIKGRPMAQAMYNLFPDVVWETSHSKGHRFAPATVLLPWNYSYGRLSAVQTKELIESIHRGQLYAPGCRGRGIYSPQGQVAELAVRTQTQSWGIADIDEVVELAGAATAPRYLVTLSDASDQPGTQYEVALERIITEDVVSSCGEAPGPKKGWVAQSVTRRPMR